MENLVINVSGGRSSAMMAYHIHTSDRYKNYNKLYLFCNTGQERNETFNFLFNIVDVWGIDIHFIEGVYSNEKGIGVKARKVDRKNLDTNSEVFAECIKHLQKNKWTGVPNQATPYCSEYLKVRPAHYYAKNYFGSTRYVKAIGFRKEDMPKRISWAEIKADNTRIFPLLTDFEKPISQYDLNSFFENQPFKLEIHSNLGNCRYCWKKSNNLLINTIREDISQNKFETIEWYRKQEKIHNDKFFRNMLSIDDLIKTASLPVTGSLDFKDDEFSMQCVCNF